MASHVKYAHATTAAVIYFPNPVAFEVDMADFCRLRVDMADFCRLCHACTCTCYIYSYSV